MSTMCTGSSDRSFVAESSKLCAASRCSHRALPAVYRPLNQFRAACSAGWRRMRSSFSSSSSRAQSERARPAAAQWQLTCARTDGACAPAAASTTPVAAAKAVPTVSYAYMLVHDGERIAMVHNRLASAGASADGKKGALVFPAKKGIGCESTAREALRSCIGDLDRLSPAFELALRDVRGLGTFAINGCSVSVYECFMPELAQHATTLAAAHHCAQRSASGRRKARLSEYPRLVMIGECVSRDVPISRRDACLIDACVTLLTRPARAPSTAGAEQAQGVRVLQRPRVLMRSKGEPAPRRQPKGRGAQRRRQQRRHCDGTAANARRMYYNHCASVIQSAHRRNFSCA